MNPENQRNTKLKMYEQFSQRSILNTEGNTVMTSLTSPISRSQYFRTTQPPVIFNPIVAVSESKNKISEVPRLIQESNDYFSTQNSRSSQKKISEYFKESKNTVNGPEQSTRGTKRTLKDLQSKYDNIYSQSMYIPPVIEMPRFLNEREISHGSSYVKQITVADHEFLQQKRSKSSKSQIPSQNITKQKLNELDNAEKSERKQIHLVGYVENVLRWNETLKNINVFVMYNVLGTFISAINGTHFLEKYVFVRGNNGTIIECSFFEIDRSLPKLIKGQFVACFGNVIGFQRLRLYSIDTFNETERTDAQRAIFLSQRATYELSDRKSSF